MQFFKGEVTMCSQAYEYLPCLSIAPSSILNISTDLIHLSFNLLSTTY